MSRFRIQYAPPADLARQAMPRALRTAFDTGMQRLAADPYGHGSTPGDAAALMSFDEHRKNGLSAAGGAGVGALGSQRMSSESGPCRCSTGGGRW